MISHAWLASIRVLVAAQVIPFNSKKIKNYWLITFVAAL
jgi:hypothetical protein